MSDASDLLALAAVLDESADPAHGLILLDPPTWAIVNRVLMAAGRPVRSVATPDDVEPTGGVESEATAAHDSWVRALVLYCKHSSSDNLAALWIAARLDRAAMRAALKA